MALALLAVLSSACGSGGGRPVNVAALLDRAPEQSVDGSAGTTATTDTAAAGGGTEPASGGGALSSAPGGTTGTTPGAVAKKTPASAPAVAATGAPVRIGIHVSKDLQAAYTALGASGAEGDVTPKIQEVIRWINEHGGMGGHKVEAFFHASDPLNGSFDAEGQATCSDFADDKHVFAVVSGAVLPTIVTADCLAKKRVPLVWNYHFLVDTPMWQAYLPYLYMPFSVNSDRMGFYVDGLAANGYFDQGARVAIFRYDLPQHARFATNVLRPRLTAHGVNVVDEVAVTRPDSAGAAADVGAQIGSAILRLRAANVTHVVFVPTGGAVPFLFMSQAEGQGFRPRYAMNTLDIPFFVSDQAPAGQLKRALAIGWSPQSDVHREQEPTLNGSTALCYKLTDSQASTRYCDGLFFLKAALDRNPRLDAASLQAAVEALGTSFEPVFSLATRFAPGRHDGASAARLVAFDDVCACFRYAGPLMPIG